MCVYSTIYVVTSCSDNRYNAYCICIYAYIYIYIIYMMYVCIYVYYIRSMRVCGYVCVRVSMHKRAFARTGKSHQTISRKRVRKY